MRGHEVKAQELNYGEIYDTLYRAGYHSDHNYSHAKELCQWLRDNLNFQSVLDIGCSHGWVLRYFSDIVAVGCDVSEEAVSECVKSGLLAGCMSAHELNDVDMYDVVMSTDCFEHIHPDHVDQAIEAACRAASKYVAMKICPNLDRAKWRHLVGHHLHLTVRDIQWWKDSFLEHGGKLIHEDGDTFVISYEEE